MIDIENNFTDQDLEDLDELEDFELEENKMIYEVLALGYDENNNYAVDFALSLDDGYLDIVEAKKCFEYFTVKENFDEYCKINQISFPPEIKHIYIRLNSCIDDSLVDVIKEKQIF